MPRRTLILAAFLLSACAGSADPDALTPGDAAGGGVDVAGRAALAGTGGAAAVEAAGSSDTSEAGKGGTPDAGAIQPTGNPGTLPPGSEAGAGGVTSAAGAGGAAGSSSGNAGAGAAGSPAGSSGAAAGSGGQGGSAAPVDTCPLGPDADANGYADACEGLLWTITQHSATSIAFPQYVTVGWPGTFDFTLRGSGPNCTHASVGQSESSGASTFDFTFAQASTGALIAGVFDGCGEFTPSWSLDGKPDVLGVLANETARHVLYFRVHATTKIAGQRQNPNFNITVDATWTAYGY